MTSVTEATNLAIFRDCFSSSILQRLSQDNPKTLKRRSGKGRKKVVAAIVEDTATRYEKIEGDSGDDLADFVEYLAAETFAAFSPELKQLSYSMVQSNSGLAEKYSRLHSQNQQLPNIPPSVIESIEAYALLPASLDLSNLIALVISDYVAAVTSPPTIWANTRALACEICDRDWIPLTYHHLIPKQVHEKALKRQWHEEWKLNSVAWLCRACHSFVHKIASNEELAKELYTVELLMDREDTQAWAKWVGKVRWKSK